MQPRPPATEAARTACRVAASAVVQARLADIPRLRELPAEQSSAALPHRFLRHCDEQTVVGIRAVLAAVEARGEPHPSAAGFGVVGASCRPGRIATAGALSLFRVGGGVTVSPHIVPQCSLHSLAGAVSVGLGLHGPHIGVGGGADAVSEGLFAAVSLLAADSHGAAPLPGAWLVLTSWTAEIPLDAGGKPLPGTPAPESDGAPCCIAFAAALVPATSTATGPLVSVHQTAVAHPPRPAAEARTAADTILACAAAVDAARHAPPTALCWSHACPWAAEIRVTGGVTTGGLRATPVASWREAA